MQGINLEKVFCISDKVSGTNHALVKSFGIVVCVQKWVCSKTCHITLRIHLRCLRIIFFHAMRAGDTLGVLCLYFLHMGVDDFNSSEYS